VDYFIGTITHHSLRSEKIWKYILSGTIGCQMTPACNNINSVIENSSVRCLEVGVEKEYSEDKRRLL
jgi:hypothetical protein